MRIISGDSVASCVKCKHSKGLSAEKLNEGLCTACPWPRRQKGRILVKFLDCFCCKLVRFGRKAM